MYPLETFVNGQKKQGNASLAFLPLMSYNIYIKITRRGFWYGKEQFIA